MMNIVDFRITKLSFNLGALCVLAVFADAGPVFATDSDILGRISNTFYTKAEGWASVLEQAAYTLFHYLIIIDICLFGIRGVLDIKTGAPVGSLAGEFVLFILYAAFLYSCIRYYKEWSNQVIHGFINLGNSAGGSKVDVTNILNVGLDIIGNIWKSLEMLDLIDSLVRLIAGIVLLICFALMAAEVLMIKCEAIIVMNAGIVLLGFGGMRYFKDYSINFLKYGLTVAVKLFVIQLMMGIIMSFTQDFIVGPKPEVNELAVMIGASIVMLTLTRNIPSIISSLLMGAHGGGGGGMSLMGAAGAMGGAVAGGMVSAINAGSAIKSSIQSAAASGATGIGGMAAQTTKNLAGSVGHTIGDLVSGTGNPRPSFGQRAASHARARLVDQKQEKTADTANTTSTNGEKSK